MNEIIEVLNQMVVADDIEDLQISIDRSIMESTVSFCFYYVEFLTGEPFLERVFVNAKRVSIDGYGDGERGVMTLVFDGVYDGEV